MLLRILEELKLEDVSLHFLPVDSDWCCGVVYSIFFIFMVYRHWRFLKNQIDQVPFGDFHFILDDSRLSFCYSY